MTSFGLDRDDSYGQLSDDLRRRLVSLKQRVVSQLTRMRALHNSIRNQVTEINRLEVGCVVFYYHFQNLYAEAGTVYHPC